MNHDPRGWDAATRAKVADALRRGDYTATARQGPQQPPQASNGPGLGQPQPGTLRARLEARSAADAAALRERLAGMDFRHAEERVLVHMSEDGQFTAEMWAALGRDPWDAWKPGRDVA